jgi:hypothetical protein
VAGALQVGEVYTELGWKTNDGPADAYERRVDKIRRRAKDAITTKADFKSDTTGAERYERAVRKASSSNDDFAHGSARVRTGLGSFAVGGAAVGGAVVGFGLLGRAVMDATTGYQDHLKVVAQTDTVIRSTGGAANATSKEITGLANSLEAKTAVDGDVIQSGENMLLTFTNVRNEAGKGNDVFNQATRTLVDMSSALGTDTAQSAVQLGKALNDPIKGVGALSRVGVTFTDQQKKTDQVAGRLGPHDGRAEDHLARAEQGVRRLGREERDGHRQDGGRLPRPPGLHRPRRPAVRQQGRDVDHPPDRRHARRRGHRRQAVLER